MAAVHRDYRRIIAHLPHMAGSASRDHRMRVVVDAFWEGLHQTGISWVGIYLDIPGEPDDRRMILGPCRDKPACSPIGVHGVCGQSLLSRRTRIVRDVKELGANYIACDPRDRSEIVVPLIDAGGRGACWGVLDVDSWEVGAFDESDDAGLRAVLSAAGLISSP